MYIYTKEKYNAAYVALPLSRKPFILFPKNAFPFIIPTSKVTSAKQSKLSSIVLTLKKHNASPPPFICRKTFVNS